MGDMMGRIWRPAIVLGTALLAATSGAAQDPEARREMLMRQIMERFVENVSTGAAMNPEQAQRFRDDARETFQQRRERERRERQLWRALEGQMRPGVAANADSVTRLLDGLMGVRMEAAQQAQAQYEAYGSYLSPVQRAQVMLAWERLQRQVEGLIRRRMEGPRPGGGPPGPSPAGQRDDPGTQDDALPA